VIVLPLRNPVILAKQLMNLDVFSSGRLVLGIGAGAPLVGKTFETVGVTFEKRGEITDDYLKTLVTIFGDHGSNQGKYSRYRDVEIFPKPIQKPHPPIIIGGLGRAIRRAALLGDGWIPANITAENIAKGVQKVKSIASSAGRENVDFIIGNEIFASLDKDSEMARRNASATISSYAKSIGRGGEDMTLIGSADEVTKRIENYVQCGVNLFELKFIYKNMDSFFSQLKLFSQEIFPSFK
jgi:alkanesulfonate monooxygenase SsuD/methylene tetrahydromethanopterin reductase-like flavin-dependent oxidoreductase (luciferase family)